MKLRPVYIGFLNLNRSADIQSNEHKRIGDFADSGDWGTNNNYRAIKIITRGLLYFDVLFFPLLHFQTLETFVTKGDLHP